MRLEKKLGLSVVVTATNPCTASPCPIDKKCSSVVKTLTSSQSSSSGILSTKFENGYICLCLDGSKGMSDLMDFSDACFVES